MIATNPLHPITLIHRPNNRAGALDFLPTVPFVGIRNRNVVIVIIPPGVNGTPIAIGQNGNIAVETEWFGPLIMRGQIMSTTRGIHSQSPGFDRPEKPQTFKGLCSTCVHATECVNAVRVDMPIVHCEEFDDRIISQLKAADSPFTIRPRPAGNPHQLSNTEPGLKGLCLNCDNRKICKHPKPVSGVWYCEEYR